jgi:hypothetical protein
MIFIKSILLDVIRMRKVGTAIALLVCLIVIGLLLFMEGGRRIDGNPPEDFIQYYVQSFRLLHDAALYNSRSLHEEIEKELGWKYTELPSANPPALLLFSLPFSFMPYPMAWWSLACFSMLVVLFASILVGKFCGLSSNQAVFFGVGALYSFPVVVLLILNHIESVLLLFLVLGWLAFKKGKNVLGSVMWGIAAALKLFPALYLVPLLGVHHKRVGFKGFLVAVLVTVLGATIVGWDQTYAYISEVIPASRNFYTSFGNNSLVAAGTTLASPLLGWIFEVLGGTLIAILMLTKPGDIDKIWITGTAGSLLLSPLSWSYYFILIPPVLIVLSSHLAWNRIQDRLLMYALVLSLLFWPSLLGGWTNEWFLAMPTGIAVFLRFVPTYGLVCLCWIGFKRVE